MNFNMLRRLEENWQRGENRFNAPGEKLLGAFLNGRLVGVCGLNRDPFSQQPRAGVFVISTSARSARVGIGKQLLTVVMADASIWFDFLIPMRRKPRMDSTIGRLQAGVGRTRVTHRLFCACKRLAASDVNVTVG